MKIRDDKERLVIAGTGHRPQKLNPSDINDRRFGFSDEARQSLLETARLSLEEIQAAHQGKEITVITGMALGFDQALAEAALEKKMRVIAALPFEGQEKTWRADSQSQYIQLLSQIKERGGEVHVVSPGGYSAAKMQTRNVWMVDRADMMLALHRGISGGTANCIEYAKGQGKTVQNVWQQYAQRALQTSKEKVNQPNGKAIEIAQQIDVVHVHTFKGERNDSFIYIGRTMPSQGLAASPLANPYRIGPDGTREEVIEKYYGWLRREFKQLESPARAELLSIKDRVAAGEKLSLACWCAPQSCHGRVIRDSVVRLIERDRTLPQSHHHAATSTQEKASQIETTQHEIQIESVSHRAAQAHQDVLGHHRIYTFKDEYVPLDSRGIPVAVDEVRIDHEGYSRDDYSSLYNPNNGRSRTEHSEYLNQVDQEARDIYERGAILYGDTLVIPKEASSLPRETAITTRRYALSVISEFVQDEALAKEKADELVELAEQVCGRWSDEQSRITIYRNLYDQITEDEHGRLLPVAEREAALERTLETTRVWATEMAALEPRDAEEYSLDETPEHELATDRLEMGAAHDENELYAQMYEEAVDRESEFTQEPDHVEVETRAGAALPETAYERISLGDLPPAIPAGISFNDEERLLTEILPSVDKAIEAGASRAEIMHGIYAANAIEAREAGDAKIIALFNISGAPEERDGSATRAELLQAYTTLHVLVSEQLGKETSRFSPEALGQMRQFYASHEAVQSSQTRGVAASMDFAAPSTGLPAQEYYVQHEREITRAHHQLLNLERIPNQSTIERIETLERGLQNIEGALERLGATEQERIAALDTVGTRAHSVIIGETERLSAYERAEAERAHAEIILNRGTTAQANLDQLQGERAQANAAIEQAQGQFLSASGFIPNSPEQAQEFVSPYLSGVERSSRLISDMRGQLGGDKISYQEEKVGPVFISLAGRSNVRLPLKSASEHRALLTLAEACRIRVTSWHGLYGRQIEGRSESREQLATFVGNYIDFRLRDAETRLLNSSVEYRVYSERLDQARTIEELRSTAREIRRDNYSRSQQIKAHGQDPSTHPQPPRLDPKSKDSPRALSSYEMRQLFVATAPDHYTDEMRDYRRGLSVTGREKESRVEALARGELKPSRQLSTLLEELDRRRPTAEALSHYTRCLTTPADQMIRPSSFDLHAVHEQLLPYERDYLFRVLSDKRNGLRERAIQQQVHIQTQTASDREPERSVVKELTNSQIFRSYYAAAAWREAELFTAEKSRRDGRPAGSGERSTIAHGIPDKSLDAAGYVITNFDTRQAQDVADYLKSSQDRSLRATGEIIQAFSEIKQDVRHDGSIELSLSVPQQSKLSDNNWRGLLDHFHPNDRGDNKFQRSKLPETQLNEIRRDAQVMAWSELEPQIRATNYSPESRVEVLYKALDVKEALSATRQAQATARTAHYALESRVSDCTAAVERKLAAPGRLLSSKTSVRIASGAARVGAFAASFAGQQQLGTALSWTSARLSESSAASQYVAEQSGTERTPAERERTRELVKSALDPEYAQGKAELIHAHESEYQFVRQVITPAQEKEYRNLKSFASRSKQGYLQSFAELDQQQRELISAKEQDEQLRSQARAEAHEQVSAQSSHASQAEKDFERELAATEKQLVGERIETMIRDEKLPSRNEVSPEQLIRDLIPNDEQRGISADTRDAAWWNMVPEEARGGHAEHPVEVVEKALDVSDAVSHARAADKELSGAREELAAFLSAQLIDQEPSHSSTGSDTPSHEIAVNSSQAQHIVESPAERREMVEELLQSLGPEEREALAQMAERVAAAEERMNLAFSEIDRSQEELSLAREEQLMETRAALFNEVRQPMEEQMTEYLNEALRTDGAEAFRAPTLAEQHASRLAEAMRETVEERDLSLDDLNLRAEDMQEIARDLIASVGTTLEHSQDHSLQRDASNSGHDFTTEFNHSMLQFTAGESQLDHNHEHTVGQLSPPELTQHMREREAQELSEGMTSQARGVDKEQTEGVRGMEQVSLEQERATDHLEHMREMDIFTR